MKLNELKAVLEEIGVSPSRSLGQNFMTDANLVDFIARTSGVGEGDLVVEVGPGLGVLTRKLLESGAEVAAVELDKRVFDYLSKEIRHPKFHLVQGDACRIDLTELTSDRPWKCVANLPYSISTPFAARLAESHHPPESALLLLQKETADRFAAKPRTKDYGSVSVLLQTAFKVEIVRKVSPKVFHPQPKVDSALTRFALKSERPDAAEMKRLSKVLRTAFSQRRKKMVKALSRAYGADAPRAMESLEINPNARAEELSPEMFQRLALKFHEKIESKTRGGVLENGEGA